MYVCVKNKTNLFIKNIYKNIYLKIFTIKWRICMILATLNIKAKIISIFSE